MLFFYAFTTSLTWSTVAVVQWHHKEAAPSIFNFSCDIFIDYWKSQPYNTFSFRLWSTALLCCFVLSNFFFAQFAEGIYSTSRILICRPRKLYRSPFSRSSAILTSTFPTSGCIGWLKRELRATFSFFITFQLLVSFST